MRRRSWRSWGFRAAKWFKLQSDKVCKIDLLSERRGEKLSDLAAIKGIRYPGDDVDSYPWNWSKPMQSTSKRRVWYSILSTHTRVWGQCFKHISDLTFTKLREKKEEVWQNPMTKALIPTDNESVDSKENSKKQSDNTTTSQKNRLHHDCRPTYDGQLE